MVDPFLAEHTPVTRLHEDYLTHGNLIVAFDFDNTVYDFHHKGHTFPKVIDILKRCNMLGFTMVVFTSNKDYKLINEHLTNIGVSYDYINESPVKACSSPEKPYFNILLDDRAGLLSAYNTLRIVIERIENEN